MSLKAFYKEALIWHQLDHPHILPLLGIIEDPSGFTISMVLPWMENGSLRSYVATMREKRELVGDAYLTAVETWVCPAVTFPEKTVADRCSS